MSLADGDYVVIEKHVADAIEADVGEGGLFETGSPAVALVEAGLRGEPRTYRDHETPAIAVVVIAKDERRESGATVRSYRLALEIFCRGLDRSAEGARARKIASGLEKLIRDENAPDRQFGGLPSALDWSLGAIDVTPVHTEFRVDEETRRGQKTYAVSATVEAVLEIPAAVY